MTKAENLESYCQSVLNYVNSEVRVRKISIVLSRFVKVCQLSHGASSIYLGVQMHTAIYLHFLGCQSPLRSSTTRITASSSLSRSPSVIASYWHAREEPETDQVLGSLKYKWKTWTGSLARNVSLSQLCLVQTLWGEPTDERLFCLSFSLCVCLNLILLSKRINNFRKRNTDTFYLILKLEIFFKTHTTKIINGKKGLLLFFLSK